MGAEYVDALVEWSSLLKLSKQIYEYFIQKQMKSLPTKWSEISTRYSYMATRDKSVSIFIATAVRTSNLVNVILFLSHILNIKTRSICPIKFCKIMPVHLHHQMIQTYTSPLMSHRACCYTCYTIQLMHYSHFKTQSLQHLNPI